MPTTSSQYVTGKLPDGSKATFVNADTARQYGATLDATPNTSQVRRSVSAQNKVNSLPTSSGASTIAPVDYAAPTKTAVAPGSSYFNVQPTSKTTTTSDSFRQGEQKLGADINKTLLKPDSYNAKVYDQGTHDQMELIADMRKQLSARKAEEIKGIESEFGQAKDAQAQNQRSETGTQSMSLARMGGFDSASGQAVLTNLERVHQSEVQALIAKKVAAVRVAQQAYEDKDFALAESQLKLAKEAEDTKYSREQDYLNNVLKFKQDQREELNQQFNFSQAKKQDMKDARDFALEHAINKPFYVVGGVGYDASTGEALSYEDFVGRGGSPDFSNAEIIEPGSEADRQWVLNLRDKYVDAGILSTDTAEQATAKLMNSRIYREQVRPPSSGSTSTETAKGTFIANTLSTLRQGKGENQYVNPEMYRDLRDQWGSRFGSVQSFINEFPIENYISPDDQQGDLVPEGTIIG